ncbi:hypothetical protein ACO2WH_28635, partial [Escherichia coli]|uniref:hypothetical protein n=1 Tax=Escherichia coli TaxID=562 RepID=UPI003C04DD40
CFYFGGGGRSWPQPITLAGLGLGDGWWGFFFCAWFFFFLCCFYAAEISIFLVVFSGFFEYADAH